MSHFTAQGALELKILSLNLKSAEIRLSLGTYFTGLELAHRLPSPEQKLKLPCLLMTIPRTGEHPSVA